MTRGIEGSYENGEIATGRIEVLSYNMPMGITIIVPAVESRACFKCHEMVTDGILAVSDVEVVSHKICEVLMPRNTRVQEIMTPNPKRVGAAAPVSDVARLLLSSTSTGSSGG